MVSTVWEALTGRGRYHDAEMGRVVVPPRSEKGKGNKARLHQGLRVSRLSGIRGVQLSKARRRVVLNSITIPPTVVRSTYDFLFMGSTHVTTFAFTAVVSFVDPRPHLIRTGLNDSLQHFESSPYPSSSAQCSCVLYPQIDRRFLRLAQGCVNKSRGKR